MYVNPCAMATPATLHVVATDMDGTFLSPAWSAAGHINGVLSPESISVARALAADGVVFVIATGRPAPALQMHVDHLGMRLPCICFNGAAVLEMGPSTPPVELRLQPLNRAITETVLRFCEAEDLCCSYSLFDRAVAWCRGAEHDAFLSEYEALEGVSQTRVRTTAELLPLGCPLKMVLLSRTPEESAARAREAVGEAAHVVSAEMHIEFLCPGVNKGEGALSPSAPCPLLPPAHQRLACAPPQPHPGPTLALPWPCPGLTLASASAACRARAALRWLCEAHLKLPICSAVTFGDNYNDIEMLRASGLGCAMANAKEDVKRAADVTLEWTNAEDGVARQCSRLRADGRLRASSPVVSSV